MTRYNFLLSCSRLMSYCRCRLLVYLGLAGLAGVEQAPEASDMGLKEEEIFLWIIKR